MHGAETTSNRIDRVEPDDSQFYKWSQTEDYRNVLRLIELGMPQMALRLAHTQGMVDLNEFRNHG